MNKKRSRLSRVPQGQLKEAEMSQVRTRIKMFCAYALWATVAWWIPLSVASEVTVRFSDYAGESQNNNAQSMPQVSGERKFFKPKAMTDGKLTDDVWFHAGSWIGPDGKTLWVLTAKFSSPGAAIKWVNQAIANIGKVSDRRSLFDPKTGATIGDRIVATLPAERDGEPLNVLVWTDGPVLRKISAPSLENVLLAEKVFFPHYLELSHRQ